MTRPPVDTARRRLLAAAGIGPLLPSCAQPPAGPSIGRVVVVGGGYGGATAARYLRLWGGNVEVTLVDRSAAFVSCPMSNLVVGGEREIGYITHGYAGLRALGVQVLQGEVVSLDAAARQVRLAGGAVLRFDRLIVAPGIDFVFDEVAGLAAAVAEGRAVHAWRAGPQTLALRAQLREMRDGGVFLLSIPPAPFRCPPAPYERACLVAAYLKAAKPRSKLLLYDANPEIQSKRALFERAFAEHYAGMIEYHPDSVLSGVSGRTARFEFEDVRADVLNVVPPQRAADVARSAGLVNVNRRWVGVHWLTLEATAAPGVHVLGDATFPAPQMAKSGHMANQHAKVAAAAVIQLLKGEAVNPAPMLLNTCYSYASPDQAMHVASVHAYDSATATFEIVHGAGGVSAAPSAEEARHAQAWAENIWRDVLG